MVHVREIVWRWLAGDGLRAIARAMGVDRKTIAEYLRLAQAAGVERGGTPPTEAQLAAIAACRRPGRPSTTTEPSAEIQALWSHHETLRRCEDELRLTKVYRRLRAQGVAVSYSTLYRFARAQCDFAPAAVTVRVADPPAVRTERSGFSHGVEVSGSITRRPDPLATGAIPGSSGRGLWLSSC